ncbi:hypothetical protein [Bacillus sp. NPDC094106]|uniref:hypothetical protein n=1 Tax=Bacillus sp. NPDC094106 TaxID=3363949 RepID=UPI003825271B
MNPVYASFFVSIYLGVGIIFMHFLLKKAFHAQEIEDSVKEEENLYIGFARMFSKTQSLAGERFFSMIYAVGGLIGFPLCIFFVGANIIMWLIAMFDKIFLHEDEDEEESSDSRKMD